MIEYDAKIYCQMSTPAAGRLPTSLLTVLPCMMKVISGTLELTQKNDDSSDSSYNGYGMFLSMLEYKLSDRNKHLVKVDKWFPSSQICHCCGSLHPEMKNLAIRKMICDCGLTISRDQNAAINILNEGLRLITKVA